MKKLLITSLIGVFSLNLAASNATATDLIQAGNLAGALDEIGRMPRTQWQQKKKLLISIIKQWDPTTQPELAQKIKEKARGNLALGHAQELYQLVNKKSAAAPRAAPIPPVKRSAMLDYALDEPDIPPALRTQINQLPAPHIQEIDDALNRAANENDWNNSAAARMLVAAGVGAAGLHWLWNWFHSWLAQPGAQPEKPEDQAASAPQEPQMREEGDLESAQPEQKKKEAEEKAREENHPVRSKEYANYVEKYKEKIVAGFPRNINKYLSAVNTIPLTLQALIAANKQIIHFERTLSFKSVDDILHQSPAIEKQLIGENLYPLDILTKTAKELFDRFIKLAESDLGAIAALQKEFEGSTTRLLAQKEPITKDMLHEFAADTVQLKNRWNKLHETVDIFNVPASIADVTKKERASLIQRITDLKQHIKKNDAIMSQLRKRAAQ